MPTTPETPLVKPRCLPSCETERTGHTFQCPVRWYEEGEEQVRRRFIHAVRVEGQDTMNRMYNSVFGDGAWSRDMVEGTD